MSHAEIELKLLLPGAKADRIEAELRQLAVFARRRSSTQWLSNIYYDTPDQALRQQRHALRMRHIASSAPDKSGNAAEAGGQGDWVQTFKSAGSSQGGLSQRGEWESREPSSQLNPAALRATPWAELDPDGQLFGTLQACFETRCQRTLWQLRRYQGASIEVALDIGEVIAGGLREPMLELELELKSGPPEALFHLARAIAARVAVLPCDVSKAERGYRLAQGVSHPAREARPLRMDAGTDPVSSALLALSETFEQFTRNLASLTGSDEPEVVHQARIAWRRWRSALGLFAPWLPFQPDASGLTPLRHELGVMRELDVLRTDTLARWLPAFVAGDAQRQRTAALTLKRIDKARAEQRLRTREVLAAPATGAALLGLAKDLHALQAAEPSAALPHKAGKPRGQSGWALARIDRLQKRMDRALKTNARKKAGTAQVHRARIQAKRARYAADMLRDLLPAKRRKRLTAKAASVQTRIGEARDLEQAVVWLETLKAAPALIAFLRGVLAGR
jgi:inorganic triphosphatase YgiF